LVSFIVSYYRLPLYPISALSTSQAYRKSRKIPTQVFTYLSDSLVHWDERTLLPLPGLKNTFLIAANQDVEQTLKEIAFIVAERPRQIYATRMALMEIAIRDLEKYDNLRDIALASQRFSEIFPQGAGLIHPSWEELFARLNDVSEDAARSNSPLGLKARRNALKDMIANLQRLNASTSLRNAELDSRLDTVIKNWRMIAFDELKILEKPSREIGQIDNPYTPGPPLKPQDKLYVGRHDLALQLVDALNRGVGRPTFLLHGERRMGKSSTLKHLSGILGIRYLPIFYDLQSRGITSSTSAFLGAIAKGIYEEMASRKMHIKQLQFEHLREVNRANEAVAYRLFDEFEKLEEASQDGYLNLRLLLDWFRSVVQNHHRLALLFKRAEIQEVAKAANQIMENWWDTYFRDLWERTDLDQRNCLFTIRNLGEGDTQKVSQQSDLDEKTVRRTLKILLKRDLVLQENGNYRIAAPIFGEWVERNS
jgi:hypothetical protein